MRFTLERAAIQVVGRVEDGQEALALVVDTDPDVIVMDLPMLRLGGLAASERVVSSGGRARVLVLTLSDEDADVFAAVRVGAMGCLVIGVAADHGASRPGPSAAPPDRRYGPGRGRDQEFG